MSKLTLGFVLLFLSSIIIGPAIADEINIDKKLDNFLSEYKKIDFQNKEDAVARLVKMDTQLRMFIREARTQPGHDKYWKRDYELLNLKIDHFTESFEYGGALLEKAHKLNPTSKYRAYTLFSEINTDKYCWVEKPTNLSAAFQYLKEYPNGPFVEKVYEAIGGFNWTLYNYIRFYKEDLTNKPHEELKNEETHNVLLQYIRTVERLPLERQEKQAKEDAITYFESYLRIEKNPDPWVKRILSEIKAGTSNRYGIYSCPD